MMLAGCDLAWNCEKNPTAVALGILTGNCLTLTKVYPALKGLKEIEATIESENILGIAIDAPLIIINLVGQRDCERDLSRKYWKYGISCHSSNLTRYPDSTSVKLSQYLKQHGFEHPQNIEKGKFQIECYPHPAIVKIFALNEHIAYKKGKVSIKQEGQIQLARHIKSLKNSKVISLIINNEYEHYLEEERISSLAGNSLKSNEDVLDSIICLYICALFAKSSEFEKFGSAEEGGYICVPKQRCI